MLLRAMDLVNDPFTLLDRNSLERVGRMRKHSPLAALPRLSVGRMYRRSPYSLNPSTQSAHYGHNKKRQQTSKLHVR